MMLFSLHIRKSRDVCLIKCNKKTSKFAQQWQHAKDDQRTARIAAEQHEGQDGRPFNEFLANTFSESIVDNTNP